MPIKKAPHSDYVGLFRGIYLKDGVNDSVLTSDLNSW